MQIYYNNDNIDGGCQTMGIDTSWGYTWPNLLSRCGHNKRLLLVIQLRYADKYIVNIHVYFYEATDSPTERIAVSFEHKPLRLRF